MDAMKNEPKIIVVAFALLGTFLLPIVFNPLHYLFIDHIHHATTDDVNIDPFHKSCKLDSFNLGKSTDIETLKESADVLIETPVAYFDISVILLSYHNFDFLLRAPPVFCIS